MKYIAIDISAAKSVVSMRDLQSTEYANGQKLSAILKSGVEESTLFEEIGLVRLKDGIAFIGAKPNYDKMIVVDMEQFAGFSGTAADALNVFQKICRISLKYWEKIPFSSREWIKLEMDLLVLIPKKNSIGDGSKVLIDIKPDGARQDKRDTQNILVFHYGTDVINEKPAVTNFRKAIEQSKGADVPRGVSEIESDIPLRVQVLDGGFKQIDANIDLESWKKLLTESQSQFVFRDNFGPERIEGAAGTGKTLSLTLRCCNILEKAKHSGKRLKIAFLTHSQASKEYIEAIIYSKIPWYDPKAPEKSLQVIPVTLQEWCLGVLGNKIEETELLDKDAQNSKDYQQMLISDVLRDFKESLPSIHAKLISKELQEFFTSDSVEVQVFALQHEIAEIIKGRAGQDLSKYRKTGFLGHSVPITSLQDFECVFGIYSKYQQRLEATGYFDSDDIILSALGQLDSPIWRRRKNVEGFDLLFVDETHLFNLNELSVMHHLLKDECISNIIYSVDRSQSLANTSLEKNDLDQVFGNSDNVEVRLKTIFRSSPEIIRLAFSILSSGSTIFTNMENPLDRIEDSFTSDEERRSKKPYCLECESDEILISTAFKAADNLASETDSKRSRIVIIAATDSILNKLERFVLDANKPARIIKKRGDKGAQIEAEKANKYIISGIDYVGGLEFDGVVLAGVDKGHMPATEENDIESKHFLNHASYNRLYVAITRAKYGVAILYSRPRGVSRILEFPINEKVVDVIIAE